MTPAFRGLDFVFTVAATDPALQAAIEHTFASCRVDDTADTQYTLLDRSTDSTRIVLFENDKRLLTTSDEALAFAYLIWQVNQRVVAESGRHLLLHAAAAARDSGVVLLPAPSGAGKSTLVAGLVASGFRYLTDDVCAIDLDTGRACAYPKPIAISARALPTLDLPREPERDEERDRFGGDDIYLSVSDLAGAVAVEPISPRLVVVPDYRDGARTEVHPLTRAEAAVLVAEQSFNFDALAPAALLVIAAVLRRCSCYRMTYSDLGEGVSIVSELMASAPDTTAAHIADDQ
jgi:hypothetical protein